LSQRFLLRQCLSCSLLPFGLELRILNASRLLTRSLLPLCILLGRDLSLSHLPLCLLLGRYLLLSSLSLRLLLGHRLSCSLLPFDLESRILEVSRLVTDGFDRRQILSADLVPLQQLPGGIVAGLDQQVHRPLDQFGAGDGVAVGQRPAGRNADGVLQFGAVAPRRHLPVDPFGGLALGSSGAHGSVSGVRGRQDM